MNGLVGFFSKSCEGLFPADDSSLSLVNEGSVMADLNPS